MRSSINDEAIDTDVPENLSSPFSDLDHLDYISGLDDVEGNVSMYLAGYLCFRASSRYSCEQCEQVRRASHEEQNQLREKYVFFNHKQYKGTNGTLFPPSERLQKMTEEMEKIFRNMFPKIQLLKNIMAKLKAAVALKLDMNSIICSEACAASRDYIIHVFLLMRIKFEVKIANRDAKRAKQAKRKKSRKLMKVSHN